MEITVLYIEDNDANVETMDKVLTVLNHTMISARDGESGIVAAQVVQPDIILMDINLPGISGLEATKLLKANPSSAHIPVIAFTAWNTSYHQDECYNAGCDAFISKPGSITEIGDTIKKLLMKTEMVS